MQPQLFWLHAIMPAKWTQYNIYSFLNILQVFTMLLLVFNFSQHKNSYQHHTVYLAVFPFFA